MAADLTEPTADARGRADAIRSRIDGVADALEEIPRLVIDAFIADDWKTLDYESWQEYVTAEFGTGLLRLNVAMRKQWTASLKDAGMSTREIAPVTNVSQMQVSRDGRETNVSPDDGNRPARRTVRMKVRVGHTQMVVRLSRDSKHVYCPHCAKEVGEPDTT